MTDTYWIENPKYILINTLGCSPSGGQLFVAKTCELHTMNSVNQRKGCDALNLYDIDYDLDDGDRIMVDDSFYDDVLDAFEEYDIEYEEV